MPDQTEGGRDTRATAKVVGAIVLVIVLAALVLANTDKVNISVVFADIDLPLIVVLVITAVIGALIDRLWLHRHR